MVRCVGVALNSLRERHHMPCQTSCGCDKRTLEQAGKSGSRQPAQEIDPLCNQGDGFEFSLG